MNVLFVSDGHGQIPGKTCLLGRITKDKFFGNTMRTIGIVKDILRFEYNEKSFRIDIFDTSRNERLRILTFQYLAKTNIVIYLIDLTEYAEINEEFISQMKRYLKDDSLIYIVGNKLDLTGVNVEENKELKEEYKVNIEKYRKQAKSLIENKFIDKYFEVSAKNRKGVDILLKNIKQYILRNKSFHNNIYLNKNNSKKNSSKKVNKFSILNKYFNL